MSRAPRVTGPDLVAALANAGFRVLRVKGSHHYLRHEGGRSTVVPAHSGGGGVEEFRRITIDPEVAGCTIEQLLAGFPYLVESDIREALAFAARLAQGREIRLAN